MTISLYYDKYDSQRFPEVRVGDRNLLNLSNPEEQVFVVHKKDDKTYRETYGSIKEIANYVAKMYLDNNRREEVVLHRGPWTDFMSSFVRVSEIGGDPKKGVVHVRNAYSSEDDLIKIKDCLVDLIVLGNSTQ